MELKSRLGLQRTRCGGTCGAKHVFKVKMYKTHNAGTTFGKNGSGNDSKMMKKLGQAMGHPVVYVRFLLGNLKSCNVYYIYNIYV